MWVPSGSQSPGKKGPVGACRLFLALYLVKLTLSGKSWEGFRVGLKAPSIMKTRIGIFCVHASDRPAEASELVLTDYDKHSTTTPVPLRTQGQVVAHMKGG